MLMIWEAEKSQNHFELHSETLSQKEYNMLYHFYKKGCKTKTTEKLPCQLAYI